MTLLLRRDVSLAPYNTFGIAARARAFVEVRSESELAALIALPEWRDGPRLVIGGGSNLLFVDDVVDGVVARIAIRGHAEIGRSATGRLVGAAAGESWDGFVRTTIANGWPGLENLALIPGSVGAAPVQNIGAYGVELAERFAWLEAFDLERGVVRRMDAKDCAFGYRDSVFKHDGRERFVIVRVVFDLPLDWTPTLDYGDLRARAESRGAGPPSASDVADAVSAIRREKLPDPAVLGNAGSFFKNPVVTPQVFERLRALEPGVVAYPQPDGAIKLAAGWLVERCGWKGRALDGSSGRAAVHDRQALVLVNRGGASGREVLDLATGIRRDVETRFGVALEPEPVIVSAH